MVRFAKYLENITEEEYFNENRISYSLISSFITNGPQILNENKEKIGRGLSFGKLVDKLLIDSENFDVYKEYNIVKSIPNFNNGNTIDILLEYIKNNKIEHDISLEELNDLSKNLNLWPKIKDNEKRIARINTEEFKEGLNFIKLQQNGKPCILLEDLQLALQMKESLTTHKNTEVIFNNENDEFTECIDQAIIFFEINNIKVKAMLDKIIVDHINKVIYPKDLKTGESISFFDNFNRYNYPIQACLYTMAIKYIIDNNEELSEYKIAPFEFIYVSKKAPNTPRIYEMHNLYIDMVENGWKSANGIVYKSIYRLINEITWHIENKVFNLSKDEFLYGKVIIQNPFNANMPIDINQNEEYVDDDVDLERPY